MALHLKMLSLDQLRPFIKQFRVQDADGNGRLNIRDVRIIQKRRRAHVRRCTATSRPSHAALQSPPAAPQHVQATAAEPNACSDSAAINGEATARQPQAANKVAFEIAATFTMMMAYVGLELIAMILFVIYPVHMTIRPPVDTIAGTDFFSWGIRLCFWADHPTCCFPSLHVATAVLAALSCWRVDRRVGVCAGVVALLISASTILIKQHFIYDVIAGGGLAVFFYCAWIQNAQPLNRQAIRCRRAWLGIPITFFVLLMSVFFVLFQLEWQPWIVSGVK